MIVNNGDRNNTPTPRRNPHFSGHKHAEFTLKEAFDNGRLAHAWLISGPKGIGKATLAYRFTRYVLSDGKTLDTGTESLRLFKEDPLQEHNSGALSEGPLYIPPTHPVFKRVASGGHLDLLSVERTINENTGKFRTEIVVDNVRTIGSFFHFTAGEGGWRVVVIDCADEMNINAANAVLKVLEEPPPKALLLLISHNPGQLLGTIRSRCRKLSLQPLENKIVSSLVHGWQPDFDEASVEALVTLADGSPGRALVLADKGGLEIYHEMMSLLETLPKLDVEALHAFSGRLGKSGADDAFWTTSELIQRWLARMILAAGSKNHSFATLTGPEKALMDRIGSMVSLDRWFELWEKVNRLLSKTDQINLDRKQVVLNVFLALENAVRS